MKVFVTGANGYLGRGIVSRLLDYGCRVVACGRTIDTIDSRADIIKADIFDIEEPYDYFGKPDTLLHLAWEDGFMHYADSHVENLPKHYSFIKKMTESDVKKIAIIGSVHEVGFYEGSVDETTPCRPLTPYGISKNSLRELSEYLCNKHKKAFQWFRGFYIVGNDPRGSSVFSKIVQEENKGAKFFPFTLGNNQFDFIDYKDFCEQIVSALSQDKVGGIINICSGYPVKISECIEQFIKDNGFSIKLQYGAFPDRPYDSKAIWGNDKKIKEIMGLFDKSEDYEVY